MKRGREVRMTAPYLLVAVVLSAAAATHALAPDTVVPIEPGVAFVFAVDDGTPAAGKDETTVQGGYEMTVTIAGVTDDAITQMVFIDGVDAAGVRRHVNIRRVVSTAALASSHVQVLGFHTSDPDMVSGTTSLGPSLDVTRQLLRTGSSAYSFLNFVSQGLVSGTLQRSAASPVKFPVLLGGKRVELDAIHATGQMSLGGVTRPFETVILDHPRCPLSLRIAYGPPDGGFPFTPDFVREIARIELPPDRRSVPLVSERARREPVVSDLPARAADVGALRR